MNNDETVASSSSETSESQTAVPEPIRWREWMRRLLVCNPFFLCSAALLLFAINRLYNDPNFLSNEPLNLLFNFAALQVYEILLTGTALVLARRRIWYDSALLVVLENGLVLVPFMLLSQAALINQSLAWTLVIAGGLAALARFAAVKRWYPEFNLPPRAILLGAVILVLNLALPRVFRAVIAVDYYNWEVPNLWAWYVALPVLVAGANLLPRPQRYGGLNPERHWLPLFLYALWITGTAVHVWSVGHIAERPFQFQLLAPLVWVSAWTIWNRLSDLVPSPSRRLQHAALTLALLAPFFGVGNATVFTILALANALAFLGLFARRRLPLAKEFALISVLLAFAGMPLEWRMRAKLGFDGAEHVGLALAAYFVIAAVRSRKAESGLVGALAFGVGVAWFARAFSPAAGVQAGLVFLLIHSLGWREEPNRPDRVIRNLAAFLWALHALIWTREGWPEGSFVAGGALATVGFWALQFWREKRLVALSIPIASVATALSGPGNWFFKNQSPGLIALAISFLLFGVGTALALTRRSWEAIPGHEEGHS